MTFIVQVLSTLCSALLIFGHTTEEVWKPGSVDYCGYKHRTLCRHKGPHVACQFPNEGPGRSCKNYKSLNMTRELQNFIVRYLNRVVKMGSFKHNVKVHQAGRHGIRMPVGAICRASIKKLKRQRLAEGLETGRNGVKFPPSRIMMRVEWDPELAFLAQRLADQCEFMHDHCRATVRYPFAGQTVGEVRWRGVPLRAVRRILDAWWNERHRAVPSDIVQPFKLNATGNHWGHFSQMSVWSLRSVGCAAVLHGRDSERALLACDYSHNNMLGQRTVLTSAKRLPAYIARKSFVGAQRAARDEISAQLYSDTGFRRFVNPVIVSKKM